MTTMQLVWIGLREVLGFYGLAAIIGLAAYGAVTLFFDIRRAPRMDMPKVRGGKVYW